MCGNFKQNRTGSLISAILNPCGLKGYFTSIQILLILLSIPLLVVVRPLIYVKNDMARRIYHSTPERGRDAKKKQLAKLLAVSDRTVRDWLSRTVKEEKDRRNKTMFEMWLACHTEKEIANETGESSGTIGRLVSSEDFLQLVLQNQTKKTAANHATDFKTPIYNVWKQQEKTAGSTHPGNSEIRWLDNLLYLYTEPFDIVVDPFAGGGSTIDICKKRYGSRIYHSTPERGRDAKKKQLAKWLSVSERTVRDWLSRIDKDTKEARNNKILDLWMACNTQGEIAEAVGLNPTDKALRVSGNMVELPKNQKPAAEHLTDFELPLYNIWKQQQKTDGSKHFGNSDVRWLDNLLYLYTQPFDIVVDPFAGGG